MSIQAEIDRIVSFRDLSFDAVRDKGVTVPTDAVIDDLPTYIASIPSGGVSGFEIEEGTFTRTSDIARPTINFAKTHETLPFLVIMVDVTTPSAESTVAGPTNTNFVFRYLNWETLYNANIPQTIGTAVTPYYGEVNCTYASTTGTTTNTIKITYKQSSTTTNNSAAPRYWVTGSSFRPYSNSTSRYWRTGHTYKWIAVWKTE